MTWIDSVPPASPVVEQRIQGNRLLLQWKPVSDDTPVYYNVYRIDARYGDALLATRLQTTRFEKLLTFPALKHSRYVVTAVDAYGNESGLTDTLGLTPTRSE